MARALWSGSIAFGLVNIPVQIFTATQSKDLSFTSLHASCLTPLKRPYFCPKEQVQVGQEDIVKGFEYSKGKYVVVTDEDLAEVPMARGKAIDVVGFVKADEVDLIFEEGSYYLAPGEGSEKAYELLRRALEGSGRWVLGQVPLWRKMHTILIRPRDRHLVLVLLYYPDEVREVPPIPGASQVQVSEAEVTLALNLVEAMGLPFDLSRFRDEYREQLMRVIDARLAGRAVVEPAPPAAQETPGDLMAALRATLEAVKKE